MSSNSTCVTLNKDRGEFVVDADYPIALSLNIVALAVMASNTKQFSNIRGKMKHYMFPAFLLLELITLALVGLGITLNERFAYPSLSKYRTDLVYSSLALQVIGKTFLGLLLIYRCRILLLNKNLKNATTIIFSTFVAAVAVLMSILAYTHVDMFYYLGRMRTSRREFFATLALMTQLNISLVVLYTVTTLFSTFIIFYYTGKNLMNSDGFFAYLNRSKSAKLAILFFLDQMANLTWTAIISGDVPVTRSYFHYQTLSLALAGLFFYESTFEGLRKAAKATTIPSKSINSPNNSLARREKDGSMRKAVMSPNESAVSEISNSGN